ncbi:MAG: glycosyltransferase family 39 protein [Candidatus Aenigmarchaeota archaeon]|nr:glycosyltransferase family 39 protein [Candidatus Aenigmarchaeota archaeon]
MAKDKEISIEIPKPEILFILLILSVFSFLEFKVMTSRGLAFGDEGYHSILAKYMGDNKEYPVWNPILGSEDSKNGFFDNPFWHLLLGGFFSVFGFHEFIIKVLPPFIGVILVGLSTYILGKRIFNKEIGVIACIIAISVPSMVTYSLLAYKDTTFVLYFSLASMCLILGLISEKSKYFILGGVFSGLSFLTKTPAYVAIPLLLGSMFLFRLKEKKKTEIVLKEFLPVFLIFIIISGSFVLRNFVHYKTICAPLPLISDSTCYKKSSYEEKNKYEGRTEEVGVEGSAFRMGIMNYFSFSYGYLIFVPLSFILGLFLLFSRKSKQDILLLISVASFLPVAYFAFPGRAEDTSRFLLPLVPLIALISANYWEKIYVFVKNHYKHLALVIFITVLVFGYYNYIDKLKTMERVKEFSPAFFEACQWIRENTPKNSRLGVVIWAGATAYNCQREVGGGGGDVTLSQNLTLALSVLKMQGSTHVFIQKFSIGWNDEKLTERYPISFVDFLEKNPEHFKKIYENGPDLSQCKLRGGCDGTILYEIDYSNTTLIPKDVLSRS